MCFTSGRDLVMKSNNEIYLHVLDSLNGSSIGNVLLMDMVIVLRQIPL